MATTSNESGIGRQGDDRRPDGATAGASARDGRLDDLQAIEGSEDDDLGAGSESEMRRQGARSVPPMGDVRSDGNTGAGADNGEPL